jgi:hypothetical protein
MFNFGPVATVGPVDVTVRAMDPGTGVWLDGVQQNAPYSNSWEQVNFDFGAAGFQLGQTDHVTLRYEITFGSAAPVGAYIAFLGVAALPVGTDPSQSVLMDSVNQTQYFRVGPPATSDPPAVAAPTTPNTVTAQGPPATTQSSVTVAPTVTPDPTTADPTITGSSTAQPTRASPLAAVPGTDGLATRIPLALAAVATGWTLLLVAYIIRARRRDQESSRRGPDGRD